MGKNRRPPKSNPAIPACFLERLNLDASDLKPEETQRKSEDFVLELKEKVLSLCREEAKADGSLQLSMTEADGSWRSSSTCNTVELAITSSPAIRFAALQMFQIFHINCYGWQNVWQATASQQPGAYPSQSQHVGTHWHPWQQAALGSYYEPHRAQSSNSIEQTSNTRRLLLSEALTSVPETPDLPLPPGAYRPQEQVERAETCMRRQPRIQLAKGPEISQPVAVSKDLSRWKIHNALLGRLGRSGPGRRRLAATELWLGPEPDGAFPCQ
eukprot:TRINITY_DN106728_c0_g1_i1.p1 TRINITY_DN106728_c0_g1~~TRINITY_DN106728_c0_g1_i1.p1  ORF type:complete len:270 (-),score=26.49 TRINITY_DN106728_c0_g1_i1:150-959(-)